MREIRYMISDASKKIEVEQHTLRYWEVELDLHILRNEMGHRYYTEEDIEVLKAVKILKEKGYQLRAIKMLLPDIQKLNNLDTDDVLKVQQEWDRKYMDVITGENSLTSLPIQKTDMTIEDPEILMDKSAERLDQFKTIINTIVTEALQDNNEVLSGAVIKEMDYLLRLKEDREEERYKQFDRSLREIQNSRAEVAVSKVEKYKKKKRLFNKNILKRKI